MMNNIKTTNYLLLVIVIPVIFYILKLLSFIFIPLVMSMFIALLFLPLMRWLSKKGVHKIISIVIVIFIIAILIKIGGEIVKLTSAEILSTKDEFIKKAEIKLTDLVYYIEDFFGIVHVQGENVLVYYLKMNASSLDVGIIVNKIGNSLSMTVTTIFFVLLWLAESVNFERVLNSTILKKKYASVKTFRKIEKDLIKFIKVKVFVSFLTGVGFSIACIVAGVSFPIFWGLFAFAINFVQMIGSFISVILLALFAFVELDPSLGLLIFVLGIISVQVICGGILEPVLMGKSFSINVIAILIMLMLWGYIWGIPGMIMSIPLTVFLKILFDQFPNTLLLSKLLSGNYSELKIKAEVKTTTNEL